MSASLRNHTLPSDRALHLDFSSSIFYLRFLSNPPFPKPSVLGGGGVQEGVVIGKTNSTGLEVAEGKVSVPDLFATLFTALGIDPDHEFRTEFGAIAPASDHGTPIPGLV